jgi:hypothetical protein
VSTRCPIPLHDSTKTVRFWHVNHIPDGKPITREHAIGILGTVLWNETQVKSKLDEVTLDKKRLHSWALKRLKNMFIKIADMNGLTADGRKLTNWNDTKLAICKRMASNGANDNTVSWVQVKWWKTAPYKDILEDEFMREFYICYRPMTPDEVGTTTVTTISRHIRRKYNDLCKELQKLSRTQNQGQYLTSRRGHEPDGQENRVVSTTERATYVCQKTSPSMITFVCNGQCTHSMNLLEVVSALEQKNDDLNREHLSVMDVSLNFHYVFNYVLIYLQHHFPLRTQILEQGFKEKINVSLNLFLLLYKSLFFLLTCNYFRSTTGIGNQNQNIINSSCKYQISFELYCLIRFSLTRIFLF